MDDLLMHAPCGFLSFGDDGIVTLANETALDMLKHTRVELVGRSIEQVLPVGTRIFYQTHFFPLIRLHGRADEIFLLLRASDGEEVAVLVNAIRHTRNGTVANDCAMLRVRERQKYEAELLRARREAEHAVAESERHQAELHAANDELEQQATELEITSEELIAANDHLEQRTLELERLREEADQANLAKSNFLAMMSHELRTPLNAISGYAQLLEMGVQGPVSDAQRESLERIQQSQRHLLRLVNEILNLARIEAGHIEYVLTSVAANELVSRIMPLVEPQMLQKGIACEVRIPEHVAVRCDLDKTQQILLNLLSNAIKFTPTGGRIRMTLCDDNVPFDTVALCVTDTGIGIPADMIEMIFDPFVQVEMSPSRRRDGTGLGLAISRDLAVGMGGSLTASSVVGEGSTFRLTLPSAVSAPAITAQVSAD